MSKPIVNTNCYSKTIKQVNANRLYIKMLSVIKNNL